LPSNEPLSISDPPRSRESGHASRHVAMLRNLPLLGHSELMSRFQQAATQEALDSQFPLLIAFLKVWKWLLPYFRDFFHKDAPYQTYPGGKSGIFDISVVPEGGPLRAALVADWATGTLESETVAENMMVCSPHYTLYLGDVYYMGETKEIQENCLGNTTGKRTGVCWPLGSLGSFALMGNHEMYSGGWGYFKTFLVTLGIFNPDGTVREPQSASFFCLETQHWLVLGLDTGYHSGGVPAFTAIPGINKIQFFNVDARLDGKQVAWLKTIEVRQKENGVRKSILLLTHHQPLSSFEHAYSRPAQQLAHEEFLKNQDVVWLFGHEHRLVIYEKQSIANSLTIFPRCIGHGGMPVSPSSLRRPDASIAYYDPRTHPIDNEHRKTRVGYNGHLTLSFDGPRLTINYHDILQNNLLLTETFTPSGMGTFQHEFFKPEDSALRSGQDNS
jgi:hypothetical protein